MSEKVITFDESVFDQRYGGTKPVKYSLVAHLHDKDEG